MSVRDISDDPYWDREYDDEELHDRRPKVCRHLGCEGEIDGNGFCYQSDDHCDECNEDLTNNPALGVYELTPKTLDGPARRLCARHLYYLLEDNLDLDAIIGWEPDFFADQDCVTCACGQAFTFAQWEALPSVGIMRLEAHPYGAYLQMADCPGKSDKPCRSTLSLVRFPNTPKAAASKSGV